MDIATLKQAVEQALQTSPFRITGAGLQSAAITRLLTDFLGDDALSLSGATKQSESATDIVVQGQLVQPFEGLTGLAATATFTVAQEAAQVQVRLTGLKAGWAISDTFPSLTNSLLDRFVYDAPALVLDSQDQPALPDGFPTSFGYPAYTTDLQASLKRGLSLEATLKLPEASGLETLEFFLNGTQWEVTGPLIPTGPKGDRISAVLTSAPQQPLTIVGFEIPFKLLLVAAVLPPPTADGVGTNGAAPAVQVGCLHFEADIEHDIGGSTPLVIPVFFRQYTGEMNVLVIESDLAEASQVLFAQLPRLLDGADLSGQVPSEFPVLDDIQLERIELSVAPAQREVVNVGATVSFKKDGGWPVFGGLIVFEGLAVTFTDVRATVNQVSTSVVATARLAGGTLDASIDLPDLVFACELEAGSTIDIREIVTEVVGDTIPLPQVTCTELLLFGDVKGGLYRFQATVTDDWTFTLGNKPLALTQIGLDLTRTTGGKAATSGQLVGRFTIAGQDLFVSADYDATAGGWTLEGGTDGLTDLSLTDLADDLAGLFGVTLPAGLPEVDLAFVDLRFDTATKAFQFAFTVAFPSASVSLSDLPLIGDKLGTDETLALTDIQVETATGQGVTVTFDLQFGTNQAEAVTLTFGGSAPSGDGANLETARVAGGEGAPAGGGAVQWFDVQQTFGPVQFRRVGFSLSSAGIEAELDASLSLGPLEIDLQGLSVTIPLKAPFTPTFGLQGLAVTYESGPVEISGGLLRVIEKDITEYNGELIVKAESFALFALGSYGSLDGHPSLFVFGFLDVPIGGPSFFFVTGLAAGFGFNRALAAPAQDQVQSFPLVAGLSDPTKLGLTGPTGKPDLGAVLATLDRFVPPTLGESWLAAGVRFTSFDLINSSALVAVEFGKEFELLILGLSIIKQPQVGETYVYAELGLEVVVKPEDGIFEASAVLTPNSYVLDPACRLTGGFAFYAWFEGSPNAGQFVLTLGGYYSGFTPPSFYPAEPRLGLKWAVSDKVSIDGGAYFALTPSAVMAGGALEILFHDGNLQAWFKAHADFFIAWKPFHYLADIGVSIGVSYKVDVLGIKKTIRVEVSADLSLWGPPTGGKAHVHLWIVSFTVSFGAGKSAGRTTVDWDEFARLLPQPSAPNAQAPAASAGASPEPIVCHVVANAGLLSQVQESTGTRWIVRADTFTFATQTNIPATEVDFLGTTTTPTADGYFVGLRPVGVDAITSTHTVTITGGTTTAAAWSRTESARDVPEALWGRSLNGGRPAPAATTLPGRWMGLEGIRAVPPSPSGLPPIDVDEALATVTLADSDRQDFLPLSTSASPTGGPATVSPTALQTIAQTVATEATVTARSAVFAALQGLGYAPGPNGPLTRLAADPGLAFAAEPLLGAPVAS